MEHSVPISDLPFNVHAFESRYGKIRSVEKLCPGIFRILTVPIPLDQFICSDLFVVMADSPAIPLTAKAYGYRWNHPQKSLWCTAMQIILTSPGGS